jgi:hypothetical protein
MSVLVLRNHNANAAVQQLTFDLKTGHFLTKSKQIVNRRDLTSDLAFTHPILEEKPLTQTEKNHYSYIYHDDEEFCLSLRYIYATLIQAENPALCSIRIQPAAEYAQDTQRYYIYFSCHPQKAATQLLSTVQINAMLKDIHREPFQYTNRIILDQTLNWRDLSKKIDADTLFQARSAVQAEPNHQTYLDQCELRFINTQIGFGLFARKDIKKGALIGQYCGQYNSKTLQYSNYCYAPGKKCGYDLMLDAKYIGNMTRFINHAPDPSDNGIPSPYLTANVDAEIHRNYGAPRIMLIASRDIAAGEQLLSSYGTEYYAIPENNLYFKKGAVITTSDQRRIKDTAAQANRILAVFIKYGIRRAWWLLFRKPLIALLLCIGLGFWIR